MYTNNRTGVLSRYIPKGGFMKIQLDPQTLHQIPNSKHVREEKVPPAPLQRGFALSSPKGVTRPQLPTPGQVMVTPAEPKYPESDELHILELQVSVYLLETSLASADLPAGTAASIRDRFCGRIFDLQDLTAAINEAHDRASGHTRASNDKVSP